MNLTQVAEATTFHGIKDCITAKGCFWKVAWAAVIAVSMGVAIFEIWQMSDQYARHPSIVSVQVSKLNDEDIFPLVFCPDAWIEERLRVKHNVSFDAMVVLPNMITRHALLRAWSGLPVTTANISYFEPFINITQLMHDISVNESIIVCQDCSSGYPKKVLTMSGVCFMLYFKKLNNLGIMLKPVYTFHVKIPSTAYNPMPIYSNRIGVLFYGMDLSEVIPQDEIPVRMNAYTIVNVHVTSTKRLEANKVCTSEEKRSQHALCRTVCIQKFSQKYASCTWLFANVSEYEPQEHKHVCNYDMFTYLMGDAMWAQKFSESLETCNAECKRSCNFINFITSHSYTDILPGLSQTTGVIFAIKNAEDVIQLVEVPAYTWDTFLSNVGGQLGLWLGASLLSVLQLAYFATLWLLQYRNKHQQFHLPKLGLRHLSEKLRNPAGALNHAKESNVNSLV